MKGKAQNDKQSQYIKDVLARNTENFAISYDKKVIGVNRLELKGEEGAEKIKKIPAIITGLSQLRYLDLSFNKIDNFEPCKLISI